MYSKMRSALTLIELIFSMLIIAIVFTVVPKIIFASNKAFQLSVKEDGMYNAISLLGSISKLPWDENTIISDGEILNAGGVLCQTDGYRVGGFVGSRNCLNHASSHGMAVDDAKNSFDDIDDYNNETNFNESSSLGKDYDLNVSVTRTDDIKNIVVTVKGGARTGNFQTSFFYNSANLGYININKRAW